MNHLPITGSISKSNSRYTQLLVSVRDVSEAEMCWQAGVDWIDLKEPSAGSLGKPSLSTAEQVALVLADHSRRSVALGELAELLANDVRFETAAALSRLFPIAKVGLSNSTTGLDWRTALSELSQTLQGKLTPVIYADWARCSAPTPPDVLAWAGDTQCPYLLIDTYHKDGRRLLDYFSLEELNSIVSQANDFGTEVVLAGSLTTGDVQTLREVPCAAVAVRGAVCSGSRRGSICPNLLAKWVGLVKGQADQARIQSLALLHSQ